MKRILFLATLILAFNTSTIAQSCTDGSKILVPNEVTAIRIAEAVWHPIYGNKIYERQPFVASLRGDIWDVRGTLPKDWIGGVPEARISKCDGRVLEVNHGQ